MKKRIEVHLILEVPEKWTPGEAGHQVKDALEFWSEDGMNLLSLEAKESA